MSDQILQALSLSFSGVGRRANANTDIKILDEVSVELNQGDFHILLGPNGAGKSSLIKVLAGLNEFESGNLVFGGKAIAEYSLAELAKKRAVLSQDSEVVFPVKVREVIALGRSPYAGLSLSKADKRVVEEVISLMQLDEFSEQPVNLLSGGERKRVQIARVLCQDTELIYFDEPLNSLDVKYQLKVLELFRSLCKKGKTVVCAMHDLNLAFEFASHITLLKNGKVIIQGEVEQVTNKEVLESVYEVGIDIFANASGKQRVSVSSVLA